MKKRINVFAVLMFLLVLASYVAAAKGIGHGHAHGHYGFFSGG